MGIITAVLAGYVLGSIPTGYLVARARRVDIRSVGSGNIGATNVFRVLGTPAGVFVLLVDAGKGCAAVLLASHLFRRWFGLESGAAEWLGIAGGVASVLGHNYTVWLRFKGGKGIATSAGVFGALVPMALLVALVIWVVIVLLTRYVSLASISAAFVLPFAVWYARYSVAMVVITAVLAALAIYKHRANIDRLLRGNENKIGRKPAGGAKQ